MAIINTGVFNSGSAYLRRLGNDWPTAQVITSSDIAEGTNLYFTNSRVRTAYSAGTGIAISQGGVISYKQADPGLGFFNSGLTLASAGAVSNIFSNVATFQSQDGVNFVVQSLHITNLSSNTAYINGRIGYADGNNVVFANLFELPGSASTEMFLKPSTFKPNDKIQIQSLSSPTQPANNLVSAIVSYQGSAITEYDRAYATLSSNSTSNVFVSTGKSSIIESIKVHNPNPTYAGITTQIITDTGAVFAYLSSNLTIPPYSTIEICEYPKTLLSDYSVRMQKSPSFAQPLTAFISAKYTSYFVATPAAATINENASNTITIDFQTIGVANGTTFYYSIDGNVQPSDFVPAANTGSFVVTGDQATISLQIASDTGFEGEESFRVQVRKNSVVGSIVSTTANILIRDTANTQAVAFTNASSVNEGNTISIGITVFNAEASTYFYSTKNMAGNVFASRFSSANTGAFILTNGANTVNLVANADGITSGDGIFQVDIRTGSTSGPIVGTSGNITLADTSKSGPTILVNGAASLTSDGTYTTAVFTSSGNIQVLSLGSNNLIDYTVVAGGGGSGSLGYSGGGGAGGMLNGSLILPQANTYIVIVGGGGAGVAARGQGSSIITPVANIYAWGGGPAGYNPGFQGFPGGSGGGGSPTAGGWGVAGNGTPNQGTAGGNGQNTSIGGSGGGAFASGQGGAVDGGGQGAKSTISPTSYGTSGPIAQPGRYFAGGGAAYYAPGSYPGGAGGGGNVNLTGAVNTGGGAGEGGGAGGSGIVIIRYRP